MLSFIKKHKIINQTQSKKSSVEPLLKLTEFMRSTIENKYYGLACFSEINKSFRHSQSLAHAGNTQTLWFQRKVFRNSQVISYKLGTFCTNEWTKACLFSHIKVKYGSFSVSQPPRKIAKLSCSKIVHNGVFAADLHKASNWWGKTVWR